MAFDVLNAWKRIDDMPHASTCTCTEAPSFIVPVYMKQALTAAPSKTHRKLNEPTSNLTYLDLGGMSEKQP